MRESLNQKLTEMVVKKQKTTVEPEKKSMPKMGLAGLTNLKKAMTKKVEK